MQLGAEPQSSKTFQFVVIRHAFRDSGGHHTDNVLTFHTSRLSPSGDVMGPPDGQFLSGFCRASNLMTCKPARWNSRTHALATGRMNRAISLGAFGKLEYLGAIELEPTKTTFVFFASSARFAIFWALDGGCPSLVRTNGCNHAKISVSALPAKNADHKVWDAQIFKIRRFLRALQFRTLIQVTREASSVNQGFLEDRAPCQLE